MYNSSNSSDEEKTFHYLLSPHLIHKATELREHLKFLKSCMSSQNENRFTFESSFWSNILSDINFGEVTIVQDSTSPIKAPTSSEKSENLASLLSYPNGKLHIESLSNLLQISSEEAAHLTYSALRNVDSTDQKGNEKKLRSYHESLLGSPNLITFIQQYHLQTEVTKLRCLTECMRMELDGDLKGDCVAEISSFLDEINNTYQIQVASDGKKVKLRGLFRMLLLRACCGIHTKPFIDGSNPLCGLYEQTALESLLTLFYGKRMNGEEVSRWDLMVLLLNFESKGFFCARSGRIPKLAALVCAEAMSLWRFTGSSTSLGETHALFHSLSNGSSNEAQQEINAILQVLQRNAHNVNKRRAKQLSSSSFKQTTSEDYTEAPEAIALLTFGLLLILAQLHHPKIDEIQRRLLREWGMEGIRLANDEFGGFAYLEWTIDSLLLPNNEKFFHKDKKGNYVLAYCDVHNSDLEENSYDDAATVVFSSIGREIISAIISAFYLSNGGDKSKFPIEDIKMLSSLLSLSYRNQTTSRISFWNTWYEYINSRLDTKYQSANTRIDPFCFLVDASHHLAVSSSKVHKRNAIQYLTAVAPLLELVSSLVCDLQTMRFALEGITGDDNVGGVVLLPPIIITTALLMSAELHHNQIYKTNNTTPEQQNFISVVKRVISSVSSLLQTGGQYTISLIIKSLEKHYGDSMQLPRKLFLIAIHAPIPDIAYHALMMLSNVLQLVGMERERCISYHITTSECLLDGFGSDSDGFSMFLSSYVGSAYQNHLSPLTKNTSRRKAIALVTILHSLSSNLILMTNDLLSDNAMESYISTILNGSIMACDILTQNSSLQSSISTKMGEEEIELNIVCTLAISKALQAIQPFIQYPNPNISAACSNARHNIIYKLATTSHLGEILALHATLPVSTALRGTLMVEAWKSHNETKTKDGEKEQRFGAWEMIVTKLDKTGQISNNKRSKYLEKELKLTRNINLVNYDMGVTQQNIAKYDDVQQRPEEHDYAKTLLKMMAKESTTLLLLWTKFAKEIFDNNNTIDSNESDINFMAHDESFRMTKDDLKNLSPVWKVLISPSPPPQANNIRFEGGKMKIALCSIVEGIDMSSKEKTIKNEKEQVKDESFFTSLQPISHSCWPNNISFLTLLSRYISDSDSCSDDRIFPYNETWELFISINKQISEINGPASELLLASLNGGLQFHRTLLRSLEIFLKDKNMDQRTFIFLTQSLRLLSSAIGENQNFASVLLLGEDAINVMQKNNAFESNQSSDEKSSKKVIPVCDLFIKAIKEICSLISNGSDGISNENLVVVSLIMQFIVKLYDACRIEKFVASTSKLPQSRGQYIHALEYFLSDDDFLKDLLKMLNMENDLLQTDSSKNLKAISESSLEDELKSVSFNISSISSRHINALHLRLCALKIIARELHIKGNTSLKSTPNILLDGVKSYLCPKRDGLLESHHIFKTMSNQFNGIILSAEKLQFLRKHLQSMGLYEDFVLSPRNDKHYILEHERDHESDSWYLNHLLSVRGIIQNFGKGYGTLSSLLLEYIVYNKLAKMQSYYLQSWRQFVEISTNVIFIENLSFNNVIDNSEVSTPNPKSTLFPSIEKGDEEENKSGLEWSISLVHHIISALEEQYRSINQSAILDTSSSNMRYSEAWSSNLYSVGKVSIELSDVMVASLHNCEKFDSRSLQKYTGELQKLLYALMDVAGKMFAMMRAPQSKHVESSRLNMTNTCTRREYISKEISMIGCQLRLKLLSAALVFVRVLTKSKSNDSSLDFDKKELDSRLVLADLVCDSLHLLKYQPSSESNNNSTNFFVYDFAAHHLEESRSGIPLNLLCICICLLNTFIVLPSSSMTGLRVASYYSDLTATFRRWNIVPTLLDHLSCASEICNTTHSTLMSQVPSNKTVKEDLETSTIHENSSSIISKILHFVNLASATPLAIDISLLFMEDGMFVHAMIRNPLLLRVCSQWYSLSTTGKHDLRGYIVLGAGIVRSNKFQKQKSSMMVSSRSCRHDPVHAIWILVLKTLTSLISSHISVDGKFLDFGIDFFCTFDRVILSSITGGLECQDMNNQNNADTFRMTLKSDQTNTNSRSPFTSNNLLEGSASLSFISELYKSPRFLDLKSFSSPLSQRKVLASVRFAIRSLCAYLGASGISRELFEAISTLNHDMEAAKNAESPNRALIEQQIQQAFIINPVMLAGGMPNARHEAISNAHYAISCCLYVTADDFELSEKTLSCDNQEENLRDSSLDGFHSHVNNEFSLKMEYLAAKALYFALTILSRANPSCSSFVQFKSHEVEHMDPTVIVNDGSIIALRPKQTSKFNPRVTADLGSSMLRYAMVLRTHKDRKVWDVEYLSLSDPKNSDNIHKDKYEKNVSFSRLAGVKDLSKKRRVLNHSPAPKSPTTAFLSEMSIGHLILALRWCKERGRTYHTGMKFDDKFTILKCLSERTILLLLTEMKERDESPSDENIREDEMKILNAQLFELLGQNVQNTPKKEIFMHTPQREDFKISGLRTAVDERILDIAFSQLEKHLDSARIEHNVQLRDRLGRQGNSPGLASGRRMRSPFLAFNPV